MSASKGYGISKTDIEASRLVFLTLKGAKPRRKVAVAISEGSTWNQFLEQIKIKLKIRGVGNIQLSQSGEFIHSLDVLQDIDELIVEESTQSPSISTSKPNSVFPRSQKDVHDGFKQQQYSDHERIVVSADVGEVVGEDEGNDSVKYAKKSGIVKRTIQKLFPQWYSQTLPVLNRPNHNDRSASLKKKRKGGANEARCLFMVIGVVFFMLIVTTLYTRMMP
eukprot:TRINITY_DN98328_c0_g1_i4.p2 TRINITY_DN98328_c0_g1~~TRINITY_DN98328_c0_g1_i4.p2  ORF type:complete len:221 (-),score=18.06 TRINITY_DN98328_c0_g1_i4:443-1105(-)